MSMIIGAVAAKTRRTLKEAGATSEETAKTPEELGLPKKWLRLPDVVETSDGRYYIKTRD
jgi:hypothetical protein